MKPSRTFLANFLFWTTALLVGAFGFGNKPSKAALADPVESIEFKISAIETRPNSQKLISETTVEGPPGTDFDLFLKSRNFHLTARFMTDLTGDRRLSIRSDLATERLMGRSERNLPIYEHDSQRSKLTVNQDEAVALFPFGQETAPESFKILIVPTFKNRTAETGIGRIPLLINSLKPAPNGSLEVQARKIPHRFVVKGLLYENGQLVAQGEAPCLLGEPQEIPLAPVSPGISSSPTLPHKVLLTVDGYTRNRPQDTVSIHFDLFKKDATQSSGLKTIGEKWAGIGTLGGKVTYELSHTFNPPANPGSQLIFEFRLAEGETAD